MRVVSIAQQTPLLTVQLPQQFTESRIDLARDSARIIDDALHPRSAALRAAGTRGLSAKMMKEVREPINIVAKRIRWIAQRMMTPDEIKKMRLSIAEKAHENQTEFARAANLAAVTTGTETVKAILLINGGACVAVLAFIGSLASQGQVVTDLAVSLVWFAIGALVAVISAGFGYLTNLSYFAESNARTRHFDEPYVRETDASRRHHVAGSVTRWLTICCAIVGILAFVGGVFVANCAFKHLHFEKTSTTPIPQSEK
jgi:hypothetical protein